MNYFEKVNIYKTKCIKAYLLTIRQTRNSTNNTRTKTAIIAPMTVNGMSSAATKKKENTNNLTLRFIKAKMAFTRIYKLSKLGEYFFKQKSFQFMYFF